MKVLTTVFLFLMIFVSACGTAGKVANSSMESKRVIPIAIKIETGNNKELNFINVDYYRLQILDKVKNFQSVDFTLVEPDDNPEVTLNLNFDSFVLWPLDEQKSRRVLSKVVQTGTDANGKAILQTVTATVDMVKVQRRSNAVMLVDLQIKGTPGKTFKHSFAPRYNYSVTFSDNIQGDARAVESGEYVSRGSNTVPETMDFLQNLSEEMLDRVNNEIRSYYRK